jgi:prepilin-type N-terminal cleavage/methylation domain-containing protein
VKLAQKNSGFTLVEILLVIVILGVVTALVTPAFVSVSSLWSDTTMKSDLSERAQEFFEDFGKTVDGIIPPNLAGLSVVCSPNTVSPKAGGAADSITFASEVFDNIETVNFARTVKYEVAMSKTREGDTVQVIRRTEEPLGGAKEGARNQNPGHFDVVSGVQGLRFECLDSAGKWDTAWNKDDLPVAIRVTIVLTDPYSPRLDVVRSAVFPVRVQPSVRGE